MRQAVDDDVAGGPKFDVASTGIGARGSHGGTIA
jgi:hypothetical protein